jgi:hypothetical protein
MTNKPIQPRTSDGRYSTVPPRVPTSAPPVPGTSGLNPLTGLPNPRTSEEYLEETHRRYVSRSQGGDASPRLTRNEGYRLGAPKEAAGIECAQDFMARLLRIEKDSIEKIDGADDNYRLGDLRLPAGHTVEVKRQPINPTRYPLNFVEVGELTFNPRHTNGVGDLSRILQMNPDELSKVSVRDFRQDGRPHSDFGNPEFLSVSLTSIAGSRATIYTNPDDGFLYVYSRDEILGHVRKAVRNNNLRRGQGNSNDDGLAVLVPLPKWRFYRDKQGLWNYDGPGDRGEELKALRAYLG